MFCLFLLAAAGFIIAIIALTNKNDGGGGSGGGDGVFDSVTTHEMNGASDILFNDGIDMQGSASLLNAAGVSTAALTSAGLEYPTGAGLQGQVLGTDGATALDWIDAAPPVATMLAQGGIVSALAATTTPLLAAQTWTGFTVNTESTLTGFDAGTGVFTAPVDGTYTITFGAGFVATTAAGFASGNAYVGVNHNGTLIGTSSGSPPGAFTTGTGVAEYISVNITATTLMAAGDTATLLLSQTMDQPAAVDSLCNIVYLGAIA